MVLIGMNSWREKLVAVQSSGGLTPEQLGFIDEGVFELSVFCAMTFGPKRKYKNPKRINAFEHFSILEIR